MDTRLSFPSGQSNYSAFPDGSWPLSWEKGLGKRLNVVGTALASEGPSGGACKGQVWSRTPQISWWKLGTHFYKIGMGGKNENWVLNFGQGFQGSVLWIMPKHLWVLRIINLIWVQTHYFKVCHELKLWNQIFSFTRRHKNLGIFVVHMKHINDYNLDGATISKFIDAMKLQVWTLSEHPCYQWPVWFIPASCGNAFPKNPWGGWNSAVAGGGVVVFVCR